MKSASIVLYDVTAISTVCNTEFVYTGWTAKVVMVDVTLPVTVVEKVSVTVTTGVVHTNMLKGVPGTRAGQGSTGRLVLFAKFSRIR